MNTLRSWRRCGQGFRMRLLFRNDPACQRACNLSTKVMVRGIKGSRTPQYLHRTITPHKRHTYSATIMSCCHWGIHHVGTWTTNTSTLNQQYTDRRSSARVVRYYGKGGVAEDRNLAIRWENLTSPPPYSPHDPLCQNKRVFSPSYAFS